MLWVAGIVIAVGALVAWSRTVPKRRRELLATAVQPIASVEEGRRAHVVGEVSAVEARPRMSSGAPVRRTRWLSDLRPHPRIAAANPRRRRGDAAVISLIDSKCG